jgi:hypothetical protein
MSMRGAAWRAGDFTKQRYLASMEGAVFSGKLAAQAIAQARLGSPAGAAPLQARARAWCDRPSVAGRTCSRQWRAIPVACGRAGHVWLWACANPFRSLCAALCRLFACIFASMQGYSTFLSPKLSFALPAQDWNGRHMPAAQHSANGAAQPVAAAQPEPQPVAALQA